MSRSLRAAKTAESAGTRQEKVVSPPPSSFDISRPLIPAGSVSVAAAAHQGAETFIGQK
jgi:hypothetical protein